MEYLIIGTIFVLTIAAAIFIMHHLTLAFKAIFWWVLERDRQKHYENRSSRNKYIDGRPRVQSTYDQSKRNFTLD